MSSSIACEPLRVVLKPSRYELCFLCAAHVLALWGVLQSGFYWLLPILSISGLCYLWRWLQHLGVQLILLQDDLCRLECGQNVSAQYQLGARHFISDFLVVVQLRPQQRFKRAYYLPIFSDAIDVDVLRRLRVMLCLTQQAATASSVASE